MPPAAPFEPTLADPWLRHTYLDDGLGEARPVGAWTLCVEGKGPLSEALLLSGGPDLWRLWSLQAEGDAAALLARREAGDPRWYGGAAAIGLCLAGACPVDPETAAARLLGALCRSRGPRAAVSGPFVAGLLTAPVLEAAARALTFPAAPGR